MTRLAPFSSARARRSAGCRPRSGRRGSVAGREQDVDDVSGASAAELRVAVLRIDRQHVLDALQLAAEPRQLLGLGVVAQRDERLERRLVVEELVFVDLVRSDGRVDVALELHPGDVAVVVVVRQEGLRALIEKRFQRRLRRQLGRLAQQCRRLRQLVLVLDAVGNGRKTARSIPGG